MPDLTRFGSVRLICPNCHGRLETDHEGSELRCAGCDAAFPIIGGIPDLRVFPDPYLDIDTDRARARALADRANWLGFEELLRSYYIGNDKVTEAQARMYVAGALAAPARAKASLAMWSEMAPDILDGNRPILEIGCGTAPLLVAAAPRPMVGVDIGLRWLVLARKRLEEAGLKVPLVCACAEALPFADGSFDAAVGESVLENVADASAALTQAARVVVARRTLAFSVPNRFSIAPDPQTGSWAAGWLPEAWLATRVRRAGGVPPRRRQLSPLALSRLLRRTGWQRPSLELPDIVPEQTKALPATLRLAAAGYRIARRLPGSRQLLFLIGPTFHVVARRAASDR